MICRSKPVGVNFLRIGDRAEEREKRRANALVEEFAEEGERRKDEDAQVEFSEEFAFGRWETGGVPVERVGRKRNKV